MKFPWNNLGNFHKTQAAAEDLEKFRKETRRIFRKVFLSPDGQTVLRILLEDWSFFNICKTDQQRVLNDYAKIFLHDYLGLNGITVYTEFDAEKINEE